MNNPGKISEWIDRYNSSGLDPEEKKQFKLLMEKDPLLQREVILDEELNKILEDVSMLEFYRKLSGIRHKNEKGRIKFHHFLIAASVLFLIAIGILSVVIYPFHRQETNLVLAAKYVKLPEFEALIGSMTRGANFRLLLPYGRIQIPGDSVVVFEWTAIENPSPVIIKVLDNSGKKLFESSPILANRFLLPVKNFGKGLFYWKIIEEEELIAIGSITIR